MTVKQNQPAGYPVRVLAVSASLGDAITLHWPEYLFEGIELGLFMLAACSFGTVLFYSGSSVVARCSVFGGPSGVHGAGNGRDCDRHHPLSDGPSVRCTLQSDRFVYVLLSRQNASPGCSVLRRWRSL